MLWILALVLTLIGPVVAAAGPCTRGTDCYCDRVRTNASVGGKPNIFDSALLVCEDFEAPTLSSNVNFGGGSPNWGPWYDDTGQTGNTGVNSYWNRNYNNGVGSCTQQGGYSAFGRTCSFGGCVGLKVWHPTNLWNMNGLTNSSPCAVVMRNGEFNAEIATIQPPTNASGGGSGVFDGQQSWAHRVGPGATNDMGIEGYKVFSPTRTLGITYALAYPNNLGPTASQIQGFGESWKHNEWHPRSPDPANCADPSGGDAIAGFQTSGGGQAYFPFYSFMFGQGTRPTACNGRPTSFQTDCTNRVNAAIAATGAGNVRGSFVCNPDGLTFTGDTSGLTGYSWGTTFNHTMWGCIQAHLTNIGLSNMTIDQWFTGPDGVRRNVVHLIGFDAATTATTGTAGFPFLQNGVAGYDQLVWNAYFNGNYAGSSGSHRTVQTTFRYEDNVHVRVGPPVSCAQIGFGSSGGGGTVPNAPSNLRFQ